MSEGRVEHFNGSSERDVGPSFNHAAVGLSLADYTLEALIRQTPRSSVYRARGKRNGSRVIVKLAAGEYPDPLALARLRHEYDVLRSLSDLERVVRARSLEKCANGLALVTEYCGDYSLKALIASDELDLRQRLVLALQMAKIIGSVHRRQVIHKDLQPDHFMVTARDHTLTLIDFGAATRLSAETVSNLNAFEGTLAYMSPEQTGRMNRSVDRRSDLYSLGATLYELFTGNRPFQTSDPLRLVHSHIAQLPSPPHEVRGEVPAILSAIVMKLLAKAAEDRYQDTAGLSADLETCLTELDESGRVLSFPLGRADHSGELRIPQKLYGRSEQLAALQATFERVRSSGVELLLVRGGSGTGKSALVQELNKALVLEGSVVSGKFDQLSRYSPYAPIIHGCRQLVVNVLAQPTERLQEWKERLLRVLGANARLMVDLLPELAAVIGPQPSVAELGPSESQHRFEATFQAFLEAFASDGRTLVFFLDDLQWADAASLRLVQLVSTNPNAGRLLIIGAYRDSEVGAVHPLSLALSTMRDGGAKIREIELHPLGLEDVRALLSDMLHAEAATLQELALLTHQKTLGNPFFVGQFLKSLYRDGLIGFDVAARAWTFDAAGIEKAMVTDNVVDFLLAKLRELSAPAQRLLELAACIGHEFDLETLCVVSERSAAEVGASLWEALALGLIVPLDENYRFAAQPDRHEGEARTLNAEYRFLHDRVQQSAYTLIEEKNRQHVHLRIARQLLAAKRGEPSADDLFVVVNHLNIGAQAITSEGEKETLARLNLRAGLRARESAAYAVASSLLAKCVAALGGDPWEKNYDTTFRALLVKAECDYLDAKTEEAFRLLETLESRARSSMDRTAVLALKTIILTTLNRLEDAVACGVGALRLLEVAIPEDKVALGAAVEAELGGLVQALTGRDIPALAAAPMIADPRKLAILDLVYRLVPPAFQSDQTMLALLLTKAMGIMLEHGNAQVSPHLYLIFSLIYGAATGDQARAFAIAQAGMAINDRLRERSVAAAASHFVYGAFIAHWWRALRESLEHIDRAMKAGFESGDLAHVAYAASYGVMYRYYGGENLMELEVRRQGVEALLMRNGDQIGVATMLLCKQTFANLNGETKSRDGFDTVEMTEAELLERIGENQTVRSMYALYKTQACFFAGSYEKALDWARAGEALMAYTRGTLVEVERTFYRAMALAVLLSKTIGEQRQTLLEMLEQDERTLAKWAETAPQNTAHRHALAAAELAAANGAFDSALGLYEQSINSARENGFLNHQALANELCGLFHQRRGRTALTRFHLREAYRGYVQWGAPGVAQGLAERNPALIAEGTITHGSLDQVLDVASVMKAAAAISSEVELNALLRSLVQTCLESAGAETVALVLKESQGLVVVARSKIGEEPDVTRSQMAECPLVCPSIVQFVLRSSRAIVVDDAVLDPTFGAAEDVRRRRPRSVIAVPLVRGGAVMGALYLENNRTAAAFNAERLRVLELLAVQATISVDNARLYGVLTDKNSALARALTAAEENARLKSEFVANTSHELRTPLNAIINIPIGLTERLEDRPAWRCPECKTVALASRDPASAPHCPICSTVPMEPATLCIFRGTHESAMRYLEVVRVNGEQLLHVINDLLDLSKIEAKKLSLDLVPLSLAAVATDVVAAMQGLAEGRGLALRLVGGDANAPVLGDRLRLRQVLTNLVANAIKFSDGAGEVVVRVEPDAEAVCARVTDQGIGIAPENHEKIFESFYQVEGSHTRRAKGTGLGLTICRRLVELHHGTLHVESALGAGATFVMRIPRAAEGSAPLAEEEEP